MGLQDTSRPPETSRAAAGPRRLGTWQIAYLRRLAEEVVQGTKPAHQCGTIRRGWRGERPTRRDCHESERPRRRGSTVLRRTGCWRHTPGPGAIAACTSSGCSLTRGSNVWISESAPIGWASCRSSSRKKLGAIVRVGFTAKKRHAQPMGLLATSLNLIQPEQVPSRLGDQGIEVECVEPAVLGNVVSSQRGVGLAFVEPDDRLCPGIRYPDLAQMLEGQLWLLIGPGQCRLGHEHVGLGVIRLEFEERPEPGLDLVEPASRQERGQIREAGRPECDSSRHQPGGGGDQARNEGRPERSCEA